MTMELMGADGFDVFYGKGAERHRSRRNLLEGIIRFFPWMAIIDGFQHWLYTHPGHTSQQRTEAWEALLDRFQSKVVDESGYEDVRQAMWQR
jgi:oligoendopeptidase F